MSRYYHRSASFVITAAAVFCNTALAIQVLAASHSIKWEPEFEWESSNDSWRVDGVKLVWGLLLTYFVSAATVAAVGFLGVLKSKPSFVRFYRDYSIADFAFCAAATIASVYGAFRTSTRTGVCEEMSRQPELLHNLADIGLSLENCESWFERAVMAFAACMVIIIVVRLHFLLAVSKFYTHISRKNVLPTHSRHPSSRQDLQRVFILPPSPSHSSFPIVYTPMLLSELSPELRHTAMEGWVQKTDSRHHHKSSSSGRILLPIRPDEGLTPSPPYTDIKA